jgi:hypothetical protein
LQPILDIQSALQDNIGDIRSALDVFCPEPWGKNLTEHTHDQHLKELKAFRMKGPDQYLRIDLPRSLFEFFNESLQIIEPQSIPGVFPRSFPPPPGPHSATLAALVPAATPWPTMHLPRAIWSRWWWSG